MVSRSFEDPPDFCQISAISSLIFRLEEYDKSSKNILHIGFFKSLQQLKNAVAEQLENKAMQC
jgi:hypothetical protein